MAGLVPCKASSSVPARLDCEWRWAPAGDRFSAWWLGRGLVCAAIGIALGLAGAAAGTRYLQAMLYGVTPLDE
jgi:hypothetical protein